MRQQQLENIRWGLLQRLKQYHPGSVFVTSLVVILMLAGCNKSNQQPIQLTFVPPDFNLPVVYEHARFRLRPIRQTDAQLDFEAVVSSAQRLRIQFDGSWPDDDFSIEENRNQLAIHEQQFVSRTAFVYTVLRPDESKVLGCVYICPNESKDFDAIVTYWIRETETVGDFPRELASALKAWLRNEWPFETVRFNGPQ